MQMQKNNQSGGNISYWRVDLFKNIPSVIIFIYWDVCVSIKIIPNYVVYTI